MDLQEDLEPYIEERIKNPLKKLNNSSYLKHINADYDATLNSLKNLLSSNENILEHFIELNFLIHSKEIYCVYKTGFVDGINLESYIKK